MINDIRRVINDKWAKNSAEWTTLRKKVSEGDQQEDNGIERVANVN